MGSTGCTHDTGRRTGYNGIHGKCSADRRCCSIGAVSGLIRINRTGASRDECQSTTGSNITDTSCRGRECWYQTGRSRSGQGWCCTKSLTTGRVKSNVLCCLRCDCSGRCGCRTRASRVSGGDSKSIRSSVCQTIDVQRTGCTGSREAAGAGCHRIVNDGTAASGDWRGKGHRGLSGSSGSDNRRWRSRHDSIDSKGLRNRCCC